MPRPEDVPSGVELDGDRVRAARCKRFWTGMRVPPRPIQDSVGHQRRAAIRRDVRQLARECDHRGCGPDPDFDSWIAQHVQRHLQRRRRVDQRQGFVRALVGRQTEPGAAAPPQCSRSQRGAIVETVLARAVGPFSEPTVPSEVERHLGSARNRVARLAAPKAGAIHSPRVGARVFLHVGEKHRLPFHAIVDALEPAIEPRDHLAAEIAARTHGVEVGIAVRPGPHDRALGRRQLGQHAHAGIPIRVVPAAADQRRRSYPVPIRRQTAAAPIGAVSLMLHPDRQPKGRAFQARGPRVEPVDTAMLGEGRQRGHGKHRHAIGHDVVANVQQTTVIVHVVGVPIVRPADRHDGLQVRRLLSRDLDRGERRVGGADRGHVAVAPGLTSEPFDGVVAVALLVGGVLVLGDAF